MMILLRRGRGKPFNSNCYVLFSFILESILITIIFIIITIRNNILVIVEKPKVTLFFTQFIDLHGVFSYQQC